MVGFKGKMAGFFQTFFIRLAIFIVMGLSRLVPLRRHEALANRVGGLILKIQPRLVSAMLVHLRIAFKDSRTEEELKNIAVRSVQFMCASALEFMQFPRLRPEQIKEMVSLEDRHRIEECFDRGKGVIMISGHFGNWEFLAARLAVEGYPLTVVGRDQNDNLINDFIVGYRTMMGTKNIPRGVPMYDRVIELLANNEIIGLVSDQNAGEKNGVFVDFFGKKASSFRGPALFALKTGAPILPLFAVREGYNRHRGVVLPPIWVKPTGDWDRDMLEATQAVQKSIETMVARYPDHWFWVHKRWKSRPKEERGTDRNPSRSDG